MGIGAVAGAERSIAESADASGLVDVAVFIVLERFKKGLDIWWDQVVWGGMQFSRYKYPRSDPKPRAECVHKPICSGPWVRSRDHVARDAG